MEMILIYYCVVNDVCCLKYCCECERNWVAKKQNNMPGLVWFYGISTLVGYLMLNSLYWPSGRVFANGLGDWGSIPDRVIPKTTKRYIIPPYLTLNIIKYVSRVKWSNSGKGVAPSPTLRCSSN